LRRPATIDEELAQASFVTLTPALSPPLLRPGVAPAFSSATRTSALAPPLLRPDVRPALPEQLSVAMDGQSSASSFLCNERSCAQLTEEVKRSGEGEIASARIELVEKGLQAASGETAALGDRVAATTKRLEAIEDQLAALRSHADDTVVALQESLRQEQRCQQQLDPRFEAKAAELQSQLGMLDAQGRDICSTLREQVQRRSQFEEATTNRLELLERHVESDFSQFRKEMSRLRAAADVETMVREDADTRLQACLAEADASSQALKQAMSDLSTRLNSPEASLPHLSSEQDRGVSEVEVNLRSLTEHDERRLLNVEDQLRICTRSWEREIVTVKSDLLGLQESLLADTVNCSTTSSLLRRVVALESEQAKSSARLTQQLSNERNVHETEARIHREETIRALREERELWEQSHMQFERRWRIEVEAHTKEKERRKEVEFGFDRRISDLSSTISEVRQQVLLFGIAS